MLLQLAKQIDRMNSAIGRFCGWLAVAMVLIGAFNALVRYVSRFGGWNLSSNAYIEMQWYLFSLIFLLGGAFTLRRNAHVRVDVLYSRLSLKARAWIDLLGTVLFLFPFCIAMLWLSWPSVRNSWKVLETSPDPGGLARYPIKTVILVAFALLLLQGISHLVHTVVALREPSMAELDAAPDELKL
ncbi:MAG: TRAP transporter small permease subunit [Candidatus Eisenbacteria bacterium]|uniref:TRAP transporter small permease subunit n=1 Tax=Eiseniibacteriota bacterium TaxID=2212470 RepID=A0A7Y2H180_UNCEI|nr:TRAP transporter small permease subunit [Candidatus Eisenbacteria bacterium]